ncbi:prominin-1-A-like [Glandiceps talaboti]
MASYGAMYVLLFCVVIVDQYGKLESASENSVGPSGEITWKDLPSGKPYNSPNDYDEGSSPLPSIWSAVSGWIDVVSPGEVPYDLLKDAIGGGLETEDISIMDYSDLLFGFAICFVLGLLFLFIFPIVAICFCGCRTCCGNCGGKMYQKQTGNMECKMITLVVILSCITLVLSGGFACGYFVNTRQSSEIEHFATNAENSLDDILIYVNNTVDEILFVALNQSSWMFDLIESDLDNVGMSVGLPVREALRPYVESAMNAILDMVATIETTRDELDYLNTLVTDLETNYSDFDVSLANLKQDIEDLYSDCANAGGCSAAGQDPQATADTTYLNASRNFSDLPTGGVGPGYYPRTIVTAKSSALTAVINNNLASDAEAGKQEFEDIPELVQNETDSAVGDLISSFYDFNDEIEGGLDPMIENLDSMSSQGSSFGNTISEYAPMLSDFDFFRSIFVIFLYFIALVVFILNILGIIFGLVGYDRNATPTKRSMLSNMGGLLLMSSAGLCFIFAVWLMGCTSFPFIIGGPIKKIICDPILSRDLFENTIDQEDSIPGTDGYFLSQTLFEDGSIPLTFTGILEDCEDNKAAYSAFQLMNMVNISDFLDIDSYISDGQFDDMKVNISDQVEIMSSTTADNLADARDVNAAGIPWTNFETELNSDLIDFGEDLNDFADDLQSFIDSNSGSSSVFPSSYESDFTDMVTTIRNFQTTTVDPIISDREDVIATLNQVQSNSSSIDSSVNNTIDAGYAADTYINSNLDSVVANEVENFQTTLLGYITQFVEYVNDMIYSEVGKCRPVKNLIDNLLNTLCHGLLDPVNGWWFCNGWCVFFFIPSIIFGVKLAKYFRRMQEEDPEDEVEFQRRAAARQTQKSATRVRSNKVVPSENDIMTQELQQELKHWDTVPDMLFDDPVASKKKKCSDLPGTSGDAGFASTSQEYDPDAVQGDDHSHVEAMDVIELPGVVTTDNSGDEPNTASQPENQGTVEPTMSDEVKQGGGDDAKTVTTETDAVVGQSSDNPAVIPAEGDDSKEMETVNNPDAGQQSENNDTKTPDQVETHV